MGLSQTIGYDPPPGFPGAVASGALINTVIVSGPGLLADDKGLTVGCFAWGSDLAVAGASSFRSGGRASHTPAGSEAPLGLVMRPKAMELSTVSEGAAPTIPAGGAVTLARCGDFFVTAKTDTTRGEVVYALSGTGAVLTVKGTAVPKGAIATTFTVAQGGTAGSIIIISSARQQTGKGAAAS